MKEPKFKDYKEKQQYYKELSKKKTIFYDSGKQTTRSGERRIKGAPYVAAIKKGEK